MREDTAGNEIDAHFSLVCFLLVVEKEFDFRRNITHGKNLTGDSASRHYWDNVGGGVTITECMGVHHGLSE